jgi:hypothetical protein
MTEELVDLLIEKYEAPEFLDFSHISDLNQRFQALMDTIFSKEWSRTVDAGVHFGFYYLSFRKAKIRDRFTSMFERFRDYLIHELEIYRDAGIVKAEDLKSAADVVVTLMEGLEYHAHFLSKGRAFEVFADTAKVIALNYLKGKITEPKKMESENA